MSLPDAEYETQVQAIMLQIGSDGVIPNIRALAERLASFELRLRELEHPFYVVRAGAVPLQHSTPGPIELHLRHDEQGLNERLVSQELSDRDLEARVIEDWDKER